jgi:hypothetical protein
MQHIVTAFMTVEKSDHAFEWCEKTFGKEGTCWWVKHTLNGNTWIWDLKGRIKCEWQFERQEDATLFALTWM